MKKKILIALSYVLVIALTLGATIAYFTDKDSAVNVMTVGNIAIEQIEQERDENGDLVKFTQGKLLMPSYFEGSSINWADPADWVVANDEAWKVVKDHDQVIDKFVTVKNTGDNDAFIRTIIAYEGDINNGPEGAYIHVVHNGNNVDPAIDIELIGDAKIGDVPYTFYVYTYSKALASGETSDPSLKQIYMNKAATQEIVAQYGETYDVLVLSQAVQADMNGLGAAEALNEAFGMINQGNVAALFADIAPVEAGTDDALKDALTSDKKNIVVNLNEDTTYDVAAWAANGMGGEATDTITINGNGYTLTFNQKDSDWNNIVTNGAKLILNNVKVTNSGYNDGPWNRHDLNFACDVEMNNVVSDKAFAFKAGAELNNVTIDDANTEDTYAIWVQPNGQTVSLNGCTIDMLDCTDGRGIKIDNQYVESQGKTSKLVTLNVKDTTFKTEEKSAILVKSPAGANITLENLDISGVAADPFNAVWVDEDAAAYADLVTVTGGKKVVEGDATEKVTTVSDDTAFKNALNNGGNIVVNNANLDLSGKPNANGADVIVNGGTVTTTNTDYTGLQHCSEVTYNGVTFNGGTFCYGDKVVFNNCTFNLTTNYIWTYSSAEVEFNNCTFNTAGKAILVHHEDATAHREITVKDCTFNATAPAHTWNGIHVAAVSIDGTYGTYVVNLEGNNVVDSDFNGLWQIKAHPENVTVNE